jgi:ParB family chromosome partitioning protein
MSKSLPNTKVKPYQRIRITRVVRNPEQPRKVFDETELQELAASIRAHGVIQPIIVEACGDDYILHDGERRMRGAQMAGLKVIPAIVHPPLNGTGPRERLERALVANVQRVEMHPIEEGLAYQRLITEFGYGVPEVMRVTGKHTSRIYACLTLLTLEPEIQQLMLERKLPCADTQVVTAMLSIPAGPERVQLLTALAEKNATARMIKQACTIFLEGKESLQKRNTKGSPAVKMMSRDLPEWDALYQLGKVPPWPVVNDAVMATCDACPVRKVASDATCRTCGLVAALKRMMEAAHVS